jgi:hypothetical protein
MRSRHHAKAAAPAKRASESIGGPSGARRPLPRSLRRAAPALRRAVYAVPARERRSPWGDAGPRPRRDGSRAPRAAASSRRVAAPLDAAAPSAAATPAGAAGAAARAGTAPGRRAWDARRLAARRSGPALRLTRDARARAHRTGRRRRAGRQRARRLGLRRERAALSRRPGSGAAAGGRSLSRQARGREDLDPLGPHRSQLPASAERRGPRGLLEYQEENNAVSIDGLPASVAGGTPQPPFDRAARRA